MSGRDGAVLPLSPVLAETQVADDELAARIAALAAEIQGEQAVKG